MPQGAQHVRQVRRRRGRGQRPHVQDQGRSHGQDISRQRPVPHRASDERDDAARAMRKTLKGPAHALRYGCIFLEIGRIQARGPGEERPQDGKGQDGSPGRTCGGGLRPVCREEGQEELRRMVWLRPGQGRPQSRLLRGAHALHGGGQERRPPHLHDNGRRKDADRAGDGHLRRDRPGARRRHRPRHWIAEDAPIISGAFSRGTRCPLRIRIWRPAGRA